MKGAGPGFTEVYLNCEAYAMFTCREGVTVLRMPLFPDRSGKSNTG